VFRHHHVTVHTEPVPLADCFEGGFKGGAGSYALEVRSSAVATEGKEMKLAGLLEPL
jgi:hypothetical protein